MARDSSLTLRFVASAEGQTLNRRYRGKDYATNVLTFVYNDDAGRAEEPLSGDIILCWDVLLREADAAGRDVLAHCAHLVVHGTLHLQGYDHQDEDDATRMETRETAILRQLGFADPYASSAHAIPHGRSQH